MKGVFLDLYTVDRGDLDLEPLRTVLSAWEFHAHSEPEQIVPRIADAEVVVTNKVRLGREEIAAAPALKLICTAATGTNNVDVVAAAERGIPVCNARDYATDSVIQHVFALLLTLVTRLDAYRSDVRAGKWSQSEQFCLLDYPIRTLAGMHLGVVGSGVLGQATATMARTFGMQVSFARSLRNASSTGGSNQGPDPAPGQPERLPLDALLPKIDVLSLHCPLTDATRNLINADRLARMRPGSLLLNTARGALVDPLALAHALRSGHLGGAGIDVVDPEPPPANHPLLDLDLPNLVLTPHTAWAARSARQNVLLEVANNISSFRSGAARNVVLP